MLQKIPDIEGEYFTTSNYNKLMNNVLNTKMKHKELVNKCDISEFINNIDLDEKIKTLTKKAEFKVEPDKITKKSN